MQYIFMGFGERQTQGPLREQGRINHWANRANARGLALLGASRLNVKTLLYCFFMFLGSSPCVKIVELFDYCVYLRKLTTLAFTVFE